MKKLAVAILSGLVAILWIGWIFPSETGKENGLIAEENIQGFGFGFNVPEFSDKQLRLYVHGRLNRTLHVNSLILAKHSRFFKQLFRNSREVQQKLQLNGSDELDGVYRLVKLMYTEEAPESEESVWNTLFASLEYAAPECTESCVEKLSTMDLSPTSALEHLTRLESLPEPPEFTTLLSDHIKEALVDVEDIRGLSPSLVNYLVVEKKAFKPYAAYEMTMRWAEELYRHDTMRRTKALDLIIPNIDFTDMSSSQLRKVFERLHEYDCSALVISALFSKLLQE